jgi:Gpi18-like mannosyltransferase
VRWENAPTTARHRRARRLASPITARCPTTIRRLRRKLTGTLATCAPTACERSPQNVRPHSTKSAKEQLPMTDTTRKSIIDKLRPHFFRHPALLPLSLLAIDIILVPIFWRDRNLDLSVHLLPWYQFIREHGRFSALGMNFSDYTPAYLYLLSIATLADRLLDPASIIRGISFSFNALAALGVLGFARAFGWSLEKSIYIALAFFLLPELIVNGPIWGQCDIIYTLFLIAFIYFVIDKKGMIATVMLGVAFSFKLQTVFIGPFLLYLLLVRALSLRQLLIVPLVYLVMIVPAAVAGRGWIDLLTIYTRQIGSYEQLSMNAPNPYVLIQTVFPDSFSIGEKVGLVVAALVALSLVVAFVTRRREPSREIFLLMATLNLAVMPYVLPEMHERYFFPASMMAFMLVIARPRAWPIVVLIEAADLLAYTRFLLGSELVWLDLAVFFMTCAIAALILLFLSEPDLTQTALLPSALHGGDAD